MAKGETNACNIAIYEKIQLKNQVFNDKYTSVPPKIVIEIDTKADLEGTDPENYYFQKTQQLLDFGVEKVIWISTKPRKIMTATQNEPWVTTNWIAAIEIMHGISFNLLEIVS
ncbi:MAG: hypothetical protein H7Y04_15595 [Verrucomicrobia bacterium]|nr:hypothetical protein [Cytophagales bacterium]